MENRNKTVLLTGATSGIGFELAQLFAKDSYKLVIVARNGQQLQETARQLRELGATDVVSIAKDLSHPGAAEEVYRETHQKGITVDILVNDAGVGEYGLFQETDLKKELSIIQLNVASLVTLTKLYLQEMLAGEGGKILQLASVASYQPTPKLAVYAATKAFVLSFSDAIRKELEDTEVTVTSLIPGATDTDFFRKADMEHTKAAQENPEDPSVVAKIGYEALLKGEAHAYAPGVKRQVMMSSVMPNEKIASKAEEMMAPADK